MGEEGAREGTVTEKVRRIRTDCRGGCRGESGGQRAGCQEGVGTRAAHSCSNDRKQVQSCLWSMCGCKEQEALQ